MKLKAVVLSLALLGNLLTSAGADLPEDRLALETIPLGSQAGTLLSASKALPTVPGPSPSEQLGSELGKMFQEGAAKLDPPPAKPAAQAVGPGAVPAGGRSLSVQAYSYCLSGRTASGRYTAPGIVAVDPGVIPLGSKLYIPGYGWGVAADTGGAIVGNKIDVWFPTSGQCYQWGVRPVTIKVFPK